MSCDQDERRVWAMEANSTGGPERRPVGAERRDGEAGFTLIETSIALVVMMIVGLGAASLFFYSITNNSGGNDRALAAAVAQHELEKLRGVPFGDASLDVGATKDKTTLVTTPPSSNFVSVGREYKVERRVCSTNLCGGSDALKVITIKVTPQAAGAVWTRSPVTITTLRSTLSLGNN